MLIVEDEHKIAAAIKKGMEQEGYAVDAVFNGDDGYDMAMGEEYDLLILDLMLPGMDGITICKELRKNAVHTPILILTAKSQIDDRVNGLDAGADDYLVKPFSFEELLARVRALLRRPVKLAPDLLKIRDFELNTKTYEAARKNKKITLSHKEFSLLEYLLRNKGRTLTKDQIIAHVWDYDSDILPNTVEVFIKNLRNKIDMPFSSSKPIIHTVRGFGYKIE